MLTNSYGSVRLGKMLILGIADVLGIRPEILNIVDEVLSTETISKEEKHVNKEIIGGENKACNANNDEKDNNSRDDDSNNDDVDEIDEVEDLFGSDYSVGDLIEFDRSFDQLSAIDMIWNDMEDAPSDDEKKIDTFAQLERYKTPGIVDSVSLEGQSKVFDVSSLETQSMSLDGFHRQLLGPDIRQYHMGLDPDSFSSHQLPAISGLKLGEMAGKRNTRISKREPSSLRHQQKANKVPPSSSFSQFQFQTSAIPFDHCGEKLSMVNNDASQVDSFTARFYRKPMKGGLQGKSLGRPRAVVDFRFRYSDIPNLQENISSSTQSLELNLQSTPSQMNSLEIRSTQSHDHQKKSHLTDMSALEEKIRKEMIKIQLSSSEQSVGRDKACQLPSREKEIQLQVSTACPKSPRSPKSPTSPASPASPSSPSLKLCCRSPKSSPSLPTSCSPPSPSSPSSSSSPSSPSSLLSTGNSIPSALICSSSRTICDFKNQFLEKKIDNESCILDSNPLSSQISEKGCHIQDSSIGKSSISNPYDDNLQIYINDLEKQMQKHERVIRQSITEEFGGHVDYDLIITFLKDKLKRQKVAPSKTNFAKAMEGRKRSSSESITPHSSGRVHRQNFNGRPLTVESVVGFVRKSILLDNSSSMNSAIPPSSSPTTNMRYSINHDDVASWKASSSSKRSGMSSQVSKSRNNSRISNMNGKLEFLLDVNDDIPSHRRGLPSSISGIEYLGVTEELSTTSVNPALRQLKSNINGRDMEQEDTRNTENEVDYSIRVLESRQAANEASVQEQMNSWMSCEAPRNKKNESRAPSLRSRLHLTANDAIPGDIMKRLSEKRHINDK